MRRSKIFGAGQEKNILVTGATGYIGSMLIKYIQKQDSGHKIIAVVRDAKKAEKMLPQGVDILQADLSNAAGARNLEVACDYLFHCASVTKSREMVSHPVEVAESIVNITQNILEFARRRQIQSMAYLSSMEIYGQIDCSDGRRVSEQELGDINIYNVRSCYPLGKRMAEHICYSYYKEYGVPVKIARLAQTFGQGILPSDSRVFVQFAKAVKQETDIVLHTNGNSMGNYCSIQDALDGIMTILEYGADGEAYNVVNEDTTMTVRQMAELVAREVAGGKIKVRFDIPKENIYGYAMDTGLRLSGRKLMALGWRPTEGLAQMYRNVLGEL